MLKGIDSIFCLADIACKRILGTRKKNQAGASRGSLAEKQTHYQKSITQSQAYGNMPLQDNSKLRKSMLMKSGRVSLVPSSNFSDSTGSSIPTSGRVLRSDFFPLYFESRFVLHFKYSDLLCCARYRHKLCPGIVENALGIRLHKHRLSNNQREHSLSNKNAPVASKMCCKYLVYLGVNFCVSKKWPLQLEHCLIVDGCQKGSPIAFTSEPGACLARFIATAKCPALKVQGQGLQHLSKVLNA